MSFYTQPPYPCTPPQPGQMAKEPVRHIRFAPTPRGQFQYPPTIPTAGQFKGRRSPSPFPIASNVPASTNSSPKTRMVHKPAVIATKPITIPGFEDEVNGWDEWAGANPRDIQNVLRRENVRVHNSRDNITDYCGQPVDRVTGKVRPNGYCWEKARVERVEAAERTVGRVLGGRLDHVGTADKRRNVRGPVQRKDVKIVPKHVRKEEDVRAYNANLWERCKNLSAKDSQFWYNLRVENGLDRPLEVDEVEVEEVKNVKDDGDAEWDDDDETDDEAVLYEDTKEDFERIRNMKKAMRRSSDEDSGYDTASSEKTGV